MHTSKSTQRRSERLNLSINTEASECSLVRAMFAVRRIALVLKYDERMTLQSLDFFSLRISRNCVCVNSTEPAGIPHCNIAHTCNEQALRSQGLPQPKQHAIDTSSSYSPCSPLTRFIVNDDNAIVLAMRACRIKAETVRTVISI